MMVFFCMFIYHYINGYDDVFLYVYIPRIYISGGLFMIGFTRWDI